MERPTQDVSEQAPDVDHGQKGENSTPREPRHVPQALMDFMLEEGEDLRPQRWINSMHPDDVVMVAWPNLIFGGSGGKSRPACLVPRKPQPADPQQLGAVKPDEKITTAQSPPKEKPQQQDGAITRRTGVDDRLLQLRVHREHDVVKKEKLDKQFSDTVQREREIRRERMLLRRQMKRAREEDQISEPPCH